MSGSSALCIPGKEDQSMARRVKRCPGNIEVVGSLSFQRFVWESRFRTRATVAAVAWLEVVVACFP